MSSSSPVPVTTVVLAEHPSDDLDALAPLWGELLGHHVACASHLSDLGEVCSREESWKNRRAEYRAWLDEPHTKVLTVSEGSRPLGYAFVRITPTAGSWRLGDHVGILETLVVACEARGRGLGRRLLQAAADHCQTHGATTARIRVIDGNDAHGFYARHGAVAFTNTLLLPLPIPAAALPEPRSATATDTDGEDWRLVEHVTVPKGVAANEDELLCVDDGLVAVIDGATDKSGRDYGGLTGGARVAQRVRDALDGMEPDTAPDQAVKLITAALAELRKQWNVPADDPVAPSAVAAVLAPSLRLIWRVGDVHVALRRGAAWTRLPAAKRIDDVLAGTRAAYTHCMIASGRSEEELAAQDPGREVILPVLKEQGRLANRPGPYGYGVFDGTPVPADFVEVIPLAGDVEEIVLATDGFLSPAATLTAAEAELQEAIAQDPMRIGVNPGTKGVKPGAASFDDRTYVRVRRSSGPALAGSTTSGAAAPDRDNGGGGILERLQARAELAFREGAFERADALYAHVLSALEESVAAGTLPYLAVLHDHALVCYGQGRWAEGEARLRKVLQGREELAGPMAAETVGAVARLAEAVGEQGRWEEAETLARESVHRAEAGLPTTHEEALAARLALAWVLQRTGAQNAEEVLRAVAGDLARMLGTRHRTTLASRHLLARLLREQERYDEALDVVRDLAAARARTLGPEHPHTLRAQADLAVLLHHVGQQEEAVGLARSTLADSALVAGLLGTAQHHDEQIRSTLTGIFNG
ncbi:tetratricopeptide repeat protein [Streptomyces sp. NPDC086182]|jgi:GNAT superfamily N-acetyltransferase/tetratricopeptide (TPR) repeat protein|uniref:tetratricopeptide repeat protein n=1 Tax=Streptomyces sp. NPDC086182 TaxID=3155058 RepID=UPI0034198068